MSAKHTPGPLITGKRHDRADIIKDFVAIGRNDRGIVSITAYVRYDADARLYAAAPDLLAALKDTLAAYLDQCAMTPDEPIVSRARAAIAKATGE